MPNQSQNPKGYDFKTMTFEIDGLPQAYHSDGVLFKPPDPSQMNQVTKDGKLVKVKKVYHVKKAETSTSELPQILPTPQPTQQYLPQQTQLPPQPPQQQQVQPATIQYIQPLTAQPPQNYQQPNYQYQPPQYNSYYNGQYPPQQQPQQYYQNLPPIPQPQQPYPNPPYYQQPHNYHHVISNDHLHNTLPKLPSKRCECENCAPKKIELTPPTPPPPRKYDEYTQMTPKVPTPVKPHFNDHYDCHICQRCPTCAALHDNNHYATKRHTHKKQQITHRNSHKAPGAQYETNFDDDDDNEDFDENRSYDKINYYRNRNKVSDAKASQYKIQEKRSQNSGNISQRDIKNIEDEQHQYRPSCTCYECKAKRTYTSFNKHTRNDSIFGPSSESEMKMYNSLSLNLPKRASPIRKSLAKNDTYENIPEKDDDLWSIQTEPTDRELLKKLMK